jgi:hypothetical protein
MDWVYLVVPSVVSIIGFTITIYINNRNVKDEVSKIKSNIALENITDVPFKLAEIMTKIQGDGFQLEEYSEILSKIIGYGSNEAVKVLETMQSFLYRMNKGSKQENKESKFDGIIYLSILISQIKYDLTSQITPPISWVKIRIKDFDVFEEFFIERINALIKEYDFNEKLIIGVETI